jgi:P27 family predicted phage terminase small subunit
MGRRGPPPKPTHLKLIAGNPGKKPINTREPKPAKGIPRCPPWLGEEARVAWRWITGELKNMGLLTSADAHALVFYCQTYARWRQAEAFLEQHGETYPIRDDKGRIRCMQPFPQVVTVRNSLLLLKSLCQEFGLTPASRSRIAMPREDGQVSDAAKRFFGA